MSKEIIKSCPFCGSTKVEVSRTNANACWITCERCGGESKSHPTRKGAIRLWNRRKPAKVATIAYDMDADHPQKC